MPFCSLLLLTLLLIRESQFDEYDGDSLGYIVPEDFEDCPPDPKTCKKPKKYGSVCYNSEDCENGFACCPDSCYKHRICKNKIEEHTLPLTKRSGDSVKANTEFPHFELVEAKVELCPHETSPCAQPEDITKTERYKCVDFQCPPHYKCCEDSCFAHKICKKANATVAMIPLSYLLHGKPDDKYSNSDLRTEPTLTTTSAVENDVMKYSEETEKPLTKKKTVMTDKKVLIQILVSSNGKLDGIQSDSESRTESVVTTTIADESNKIKYPKKFQEHEKPTTKEKPVITKKPELEEPDVTEKPPLSDRRNDGDPNSDKCPAENLICSSPLDDRDTKQFDCDLRKCPENFFCCKDNCFKHRICKELPSSKGTDLTSSRVREVCPTNEESCILPADLKHASFCTQDSCSSGLKCCSDACFKRNVCIKPEIIIESRVETCPEEPKTCDSFLRNVSIHSKYICILNESSCPEDYKCCSDPCHRVDLCKTPEVHFVVKKLIPSTIYQEEVTTKLSESQSPIATKLGESQSPVATKLDKSQSPTCPNTDISCPTAFNADSTNKFRCESDGQCPQDFKCCPHSCFPHKICTHVKLIPPTIYQEEVTTKSSESQSPVATKLGESQSPVATKLDKSQYPTCPNTDISCSTAFNADSTNKFRCESDGQCPQDFKCCPHSCFPHKICTHVN